jgi:FMN-dependent NADH-azoreductase
MIQVITFLPRAESRTAQLYADFRTALLSGPAQPEIRERDLVREPEPALAPAEITGRLENPSPAARALLDASGLVLVFPTWNFAPPAQIKAWIDRVVVPGLTFTFDEQGLRSRLHGRPLQVITSAGGPYADGFFPTLPLERLFGAFLGMDWLPPVVATEQDLPSGPQRLQAARAQAIAAAAEYRARMDSRPIAAGQSA